jgi:elongation factor Ts
MSKIENIKELRDKTGAGVLDCQKALKEANNDLDKAIEILRKKGQKIMAKKQSRCTNEGIVESYIHTNNKIGVLVVLVCETDFVARNKEFKELAHDLAMQIAANNPQWIKPEDIPSEIIKKEKELIQENLSQDKPQQVQDKIIQGKLNKFYAEVCLLEQPFIKEEDKKIKELIQEKVAKLGENIQISQFIRFEI